MRPPAALENVVRAAILEAVHEVRANQGETFLHEMLTKLTAQDGLTGPAALCGILFVVM